MMMKMMDDPPREKMIEIMKEHVSEMNDLLSSNLTEQEFNEKMVSMMQEHMNDMQDLMPNQMSPG
jgi:protein-tyrosine-phosphatase